MQYNCDIDYYRKIKNLAYTLSQLLIKKNTEKELIK